MMRQFGGILERMDEMKQSGMESADVDNCGYRVRSIHARIGIVSVFVLFFIFVFFEVRRKGAGTLLVK